MQVLQLALQQIAAQSSGQKQAATAKCLLLAISRAGQDVIDAAISALQATESDRSEQTAE